MKRICPNPMPWHQAFERLTNYARSHSCTPPSPPKPLILAGWAYSNDVEKMQRWEETIAWAEKNGCTNLVAGIPEEDFYFVERPTAFTVGPLGGPMYRAWEFEAKSRPSPRTDRAFVILYDSQCGRRIVGDEIGDLDGAHWHSPEKKHVVSLFSPMPLLTHRGAVGRHLSTQGIGATNLSLVLGQRSTRLSPPHEVFDHVGFPQQKTA